MEIKQAVGWAAQICYCGGNGEYRLVTMETTVSVRSSKNRILNICKALWEFSLVANITFTVMVHLRDSKVDRTDQGWSHGDSTGTYLYVSHWTP